ncbi:MAG: PorP/SprF family type IX secretion system membrane protein [Lewinellaceae bacterium]|nr:PorP/SprF family type IX secretion system membrane protein [Lewinellaceae bacterium]
MKALMQLCVGVALFYAWPLFSQDIHFSQYYHAPQHINPALTAINPGDISFTANYRSQWRSSLYEPYTTVFVSADRKFYLRKKDNQLFGGGLMIYYDGAGDGNLNIAQIGLSGSYAYAFDRENVLSLGLQASFSQRAFNLDGLSFDNQYIDGIYDPAAPVNESFQDLRTYFPSFGAGLNFHGKQHNKRTRMDIGGGVFNLNRPNQSFRDDVKSALPMRFTVYMMPTIQLFSHLDLALAGSAQFQGSYVEALGGGGLRIHLSTRRAREMAVMLGGAYRFNSLGDAIIPGIEFQYAGFLLGLTYDINISKYQAATNRNGGPELAVRYLITHVRTLDEFRICRLF